MIDEEITYREKGYYSTDLSKGSHKEVWRVCDECGGGRWLKFCQYRSLCRKCANENPKLQTCKIPTKKHECIDDDITYAEKGYRSTDLKPGSNKPVWAICQGENCERKGGRGRWVQFRYYRDLCRMCTDKIRYAVKDEDKIEKLDYIDDDITFAEKGYRSTDLKPQSNKPVWAICHGENCEREGGRGRWVMFCQCRELCNLCANKTEEHKVKISEANIGKNTGENNGNWNGGSSFEPYCEKFNEAFKEDVREKFDRLCFMCLMDEEENERKLSVHHVNYDKECICNGKDCEFVPLCVSCHSKTNYDRELWERLIINVLYYEGWID